MSIVFIILGLVGLGLQVVVIYTMTKGAYRQFPGIFFFLLVLLLTSIADISVFQILGGWPEWYRESYYINNIARYFSGFVAVISLIYTATAKSPRRAATRMKLLVATIIVVIGSFLLSIDPNIDVFMNEAGRNLSFVTVILNLVLWFSLIKARAEDRRLFIVSGGLGLNMAGEAIGQSLLQMGESTVIIGNLMQVCSHLLCLIIWWNAFRYKEQEQRLPDSIASP